MYIKPTYKQGMLLDTGYFTHHFIYNGTALTASSTEIPFSNNVAYLNSNWQQTAFAFPSLFFMTIDVRTGYWSEATGDATQIIFRKSKTGGTRQLN